MNPESIGVDSNHFMFKIARAMEITQQNSWPGKSYFGIKEYPKSSMDLLDVTITFYKKEKQAMGGKIILRFVKFSPVNKIAFFEIDGDFLEEETISPK